MCARNLARVAESDLARGQPIPIRQASELRKAVGLLEGHHGSQAPRRVKNFVANMPELRRPPDPALWAKKV